MPKSKIGNSKLGVSWYIPNRKTPIGYTTVATSNLISIFAEEGFTFEEAFSAVNYDPDAKEILGKYIQLGYAKTSMIEFGIR